MSVKIDNLNEFSKSKLSISKIITSDPSLTVKEIMETDILPIDVKVDD